MPKTPAPRVRTVNLYTVERDGQPVAQAEAISQAEAVALWVASQQQPTLAARLSTPREARALAHLPLLLRGAAAPAHDPHVQDMFDDAPAEIHTPSQPTDMGGYRLPEWAVDDSDWRAAGVVPVTHHAEDALAMVDPITALDGGPTRSPDPLGLDAEAIAIMERLSAVLPGEPAKPVVLDASAPAGVELDSSESGVADAPEPDAAAWTARLSNAYHAGLSLGHRGLRRYSQEMLGAEAEFSDGLSEQQAEAVCAEVLRGFDEGHAASRSAPESKGAGKVAAKYRNPTTGESWSGRGLKPKWVLLAIDEGKVLEDFRITA